MRKKVILLFATTLLVLIAVTGPNALAADPANNNHTAETLNQSVEPPTPDLSALSPDRLIPPAGGKPGLYIETGLFNVLSPAQDYFAVGSFKIWEWSSLNPGPGSYDWDKLDTWIQQSVDAGYTNIGITIMTYTGRFVGCPLQGVDMMPQWVQNGPDNVWGTEDDSVFASDYPDQRDPDREDRPQWANCTNFEGPWYLPDYLDSWYNQSYKTFVNALASHLFNHPHRDKISFVAVGTGKDGENKPADNEDDPSLQAHGLSQTEWVQHVQEVIDEYTGAFYDGSGFPRIQLLTQNVPFYLSATERRDIGAYAAARNVGISLNNITADFDTVELCGNPSPTRNCTGFYDQARQYNKSVPIALESYDYMMRTPNEFYWAMARALDVKVDYIRLSHFWDTQTNEINLATAEWASKYAGKGFQVGDTEPPSVWSRMREHKDPCFLTYATLPTCNDWPTIGNYEFYLNQLHLPEYAGITIPVTDDGGPTAPDRVKKTGFDGAGSTVANKRWHTNYSPHDPALKDAGLLEIVGNPWRAQNQVDPGWVARRSDQATGHYRFIFDAADRYFDRSQPPAESTFKAIVTITYLDKGSDQWLLAYDAVGGPKAAKVYAINDWTVRRGLAVDEFLPVDGVLQTPIDYIQKTNTGKWKTATFLIEDGNFNNGLLSGKADLYIDTRSKDGKLDGDEWIHHVDLRKVDEFIEVTPTPTPTRTPTPSITPTPMASPTQTPTPTKTPTVTPSVGAITGFVYVDLNGNSAPDTGEGIPGAQLSVVGPNSFQTTSGADGAYHFPGLQPGQTYVLSETPPPGYGEAIPVSSIAVPVSNGTFNWHFRHEPVAATATPTATPTSTPVTGPTDPGLFLPMMLRN
ncbi:MAG: hypothetical protein J5I90_01450 [Caldilineales bacterium]|nr:hypothetical protein [Caldilineales bacterium]